MENKNTLFLQHLLQLIQQEADEISSMSSAPDSFEAGKAFGFYQIMEYILECSRVFGIPLSELGISDFDPDKLL